MESCEDKHEQVIFEGGRLSACPVCEMRDDLSEEIDKLQKEISDHVCETGV